MIVGLCKQKDQIKSGFWYVTW